MRFRSLTAMALLVLPSSLLAQNWTAAEKEVLQALEACTQAYADGNLPVAQACTHDDFVGWRYDMPGTRSKLFGTREDEYLRAAGWKPVTWAIEPLSVKIYGNVAIIHYYGYQVSRSKDGEDHASRYRWTDIMLKQGNRWVWIADHGGIDPGNKPAGN